MISLAHLTFLLAVQGIARPCHEASQLGAMCNARHHLQRCLSLLL
jgi:hypothetical protein